jgi:hypothetical protein
MRELLARPTPVELSDDPRFAQRVARLALTALVALGAIWGLAVTTLEAPPTVTLALAGGWLLMPTILAASLRVPLLRYGLVVPASLVSIALLGISIAWLPAGTAAAIGWLLITAGVLFGGMLGLWFWFRFLPVPRALHDPFSRGRLALIKAHVALIVGGMALVGTSLI